MNKIIIITISLIALLVSTSLASEGTAVVKLGYIMPDEMDHLGVNQETFNTYEGLALSFEDIRYQFENGVNLSGALTDLTLENRNLRLSVTKPGLISFSVNHNKYQRIYDANSDYKTRRMSTGFNGYIKPQKNIKLYGGFSNIEKEGTTELVYRPVIDSFHYEQDYQQYTYNYGAEGLWSYGRIKTEYKESYFYDDIEFANDRKSKMFNINFYTSIPQYKHISIAGGLIKRDDDYYDRDIMLESKSIWGAAKVLLKKDVTLNYRLVSTTTDHSETTDETSNILNSLSITKKWLSQAGLTFAYEHHSSDEKINHTISNGIILSGWLRANSKWLVKGRYSFIGKETDHGTTLIGDVDRSRVMFKIRYHDAVWGGWEGKFEQRIKEYKEFSSRSDYTSYSTRLFLNSKIYGKFVVGYSYYLGEYANQTALTTFEFTDHIINASYYPLPFKQFQFGLSGNYYRTQRDLDVEKFSANINAKWEVHPGSFIEGKYRVYTFDDWQVAANTYTANIIEITFIKELKL